MNSSKSSSRPALAVPVPAPVFHLPVLRCWGSATCNRSVKTALTHSLAGWNSLLHVVVNSQRWICCRKQLNGTIHRCCGLQALPLSENSSGAEGMGGASPLTLGWRQDAERNRAARGPEEGCFRCGFSLLVITGAVLGGVPMKEGSDPPPAAYKSSLRHVLSEGLSWLPGVPWPDCLPCL